MVERIKDSILPDWREIKKPFKIIECSIMDLADDIAYSTYDLEDCLKAGFLTPADILSSSTELLDRVARKVSAKIKDNISAGEAYAVVPGPSTSGVRRGGQAETDRRTGLRGSCRIPSAVPGLAHAPLAGAGGPTNGEGTNANRISG